MHRPIHHAVAAAVVALSLTACAGAKGPSDEEVEKRIATELRAEGLSATEATCFAKAIIDDVGVDKVKKVKFDEAAPTDAMSKDVVTAAIAARTSCNIDASKLSSG